MPTVAGLLNSLPDGGYSGVAASIPVALMTDVREEKERQVHEYKAFLHGLLLDV